MKKFQVKKMLSLILSVLMLTALLASCKSDGGESSTSSDVASTSSSEAPKPLKIGLVQFTEHASLDTIRESFLARIDEWGYDETKISIDYQNGSGDTANLNSICQKFVGDGVDVIVAIATPAAQIAVSAVEGTDIKVVFAAVNNPVDSLGIKTPEKPEGNITGTSDRIPVSSTIDLALKVNPELKTFGLLYNSGETNSVDAVEAAKAYCAEKEIAVVEGTVSNTSEIQQVATNLATQVDAIFTSTDNSIAQNMPVVVEAANAAKVPFYVGADSMVKDGALAAIGIDYSKLGAETADQAIEILEGKPVSEVPVKFFETYDTYINQTTLKTLGIEFPEDILSSAITFE
ncbi:ABC transporter substrate-binding protein [Scatolibacter rhodanostii]|uniref:ABC transporter substrate-binding protein n=1 Tax=Scatolibacter rhodanostii TaxID=2014781 RepID=UPI000C07EA8D|nr:ABC transporter substrate-binding protein [Scatolibacter rhodanostii]